MPITPLKRRNAFLALSALVIFFIFSSTTLALAARAGNRESASEPSFNRTAPLVSPTNTPSSRAQIQAQPHALTQSAPTFGPNLIQNPSFETASGALPAHWSKGGYGTNTRTLTYPVTGTGGTGTKAAGITISGYTNGDAKWFPDDVPVTAGHTYEFSDMVKSTVPSIVDIRFTLAGGTQSYVDILTVPASSSFITNTVQFVAPANALSATVFHLIKQNGSLTTDDYSLREVTQSQQSGNFISNGDFELAGSNGLPQHWIKGGSGTNTRTFAYPVAGQSGNAPRVTITNYTSGDAKWASDIIPLPPGAYTYSDSYISTVPSILTAQFQLPDGSFTYSNIKTLPAASNWASAQAVFTMPSNATGVRIFHLIKQNGTLTIDDASITSPQSSSQGIFSTGAVTFRFDDGLKNQYVNAAPVLDDAGFKATFYIITRQIADNNFPGYMSVAQIKDLFARGYEIGAHTQTHPHLTTLTSAQQQNEIVGSRQDILGWNVGPAVSFSYPFGEYDSTTIGIVKNAGFQSAVATISGYVTPSSDHYQLEYQEPRNNTTLAQMKQWVDTAVQTHTWLIVTLHDVDTSGNLYAITPAMFQDIVTYVKQTGIPVVTIAQGMQSM